MARIWPCVSVFSIAAGAAGAGGIDRSGQAIALLFEDGNAAEFTLSRAWPTLGGTGLGIPGVLPGGTGYPDAGAPFSVVSGGAKWQLSPDWSVALLIDTPYGADVRYSGDPAATELGGTSVLAGSVAATALLRYRLDAHWAVHGGLRLQRAGGEIRLGGLSYGFDAATSAALGLPTLNGYRVVLEDRVAPGWVAGLSYEVPEIALRVALTWFSEVAYDFETTETGPSLPVDADGNPATPPVLLPLLTGTSRTRVKLPQAVNLDVQTGIAPDTLLFGQVRWVDWSAFRIDPDRLVAVTGEGLIDLKDTRTWTLGVGHRLNETWAGSVAVIHDEPTKRLASPLSPIDGYTAVAIGASFAMNERVTLSAALRHFWLGDSMPETGTPDVARADFSDNTVTTLHLRLAVTF